MNTTTLVVTAGAFVVAGTWAQKKKFDAKIAVGTVFTAVGIALISNFQPEIGHGLAVVILITAFMTYAVPIFKGLGLIK